jgi:hypothetical protein
MGRLIRLAQPLGRRWVERASRLTEPSAPISATNALFAHSQSSTGRLKRLTVRQYVFIGSRTLHALQTCITAMFSASSV